MSSQTPKKLFLGLPTTHTRYLPPDGIHLLAKLQDTVTTLGIRDTTELSNQMRIIHGGGAFTDYMNLRTLYTLSPIVSDPEAALAQALRETKGGSVVEFTVTSESLGNFRQKQEHFQRTDGTIVEATRYEIPPRLLAERLKAEPDKWQIEVHQVKAPLREGSQDLRNV